MASQTPEARLRIIAENFARAALDEARREVQGVGDAAKGAAGGFGDLVTQNRKLANETGNATRGTRLFQNGLQQLAFQATGIQGPLGNVTRGVALMGLSSVAVTGALAGVGALALGYRVLTRDARAASEAADRLTDSIKKQSAGGQLRGIQSSLTESGGRAFRAAGLAQDEAGGFNPFLHLAAVLRQRADERAGEKAVGAVLALREARGDAHREAIRALELQASLMGQSAEEQARLTAAARGYTVEETNRLIVATRHLETKKEEARVLALQRDLLEEITRLGDEVAQTFDGRVLQDIRVPDLDEILGRTKFGTGIDVDMAQAFVAARKQAGLDFDMPMAGKGDAGGKALIEGARRPDEAGNRRAAQMAVLSVLSMTSGGAQGVFGGLGGLATGLSGIKGIAGTAAAGPLGIAGLGLTFLGGVLGRNREAERLQREQLEELRRIRQNTDTRGRPQNVDVHVHLDSEEISDRVMYDIRRAERRDATPRLPPR